MDLSEQEDRMNGVIQGIETPIKEKKRLYKQTWRNWIFLISVLALITTGLATALPPLLSERIVNPWPWVKTDMVLIIGLSLVVLVFIGYMTQQQRHVINLHQRLEGIQARTDMKLRQNAERLFALSNMSRIMGTETDLHRIFDAITSICSETFNSDRATLMLRDEQGEYLEVKSACGRSSEELIYRRRRIGEGIAGSVAMKRKPVLLNSSKGSGGFPKKAFKDPSISSAMVTPIIVRDELVGVLNVTSQSQDIIYEPDDLQALQVLAYNAGVCIRHMEHINWIKKIGPTLKTMETTEKKYRR